MHAIRVHSTGGPEVLAFEDNVPTPQPGTGEVLIKVSVAGVNFVDVYNRVGRYPQTLPFTPGVEAAGIVEALGAGVTEFKLGDKVACYIGSGCYAEYVVAPVARVVAIPSGLDDKAAIAGLVQGLTAHFLSHDTYPIKSGDTVLIHAAAGGVGLVLTQMAKMLGAHILATVSTEAKAQLAREAGADEVILYSQVDFESEVKRLTNGKGVACVYDSVGKTTFDKSLNCLRPLGYMVLYGASSGAVPPFDPITLMGKGSLFLTRPTLGHYIATPEILRRRTDEVFGWIASGALKVRAEHTYPLAEVAQAHRDLEARATTGKLLLMV
jgi:NADPH:quinone reductase